jgi:hypothetical protein
MTRHPIRYALFSGLLLAPALVAWGPRAAAQGTPEPDPADDQDTELGESPERYAQVRKVEGTVLLRKGDVEEALTRGLPVGEGDVVESHGRGILQLGDGSSVAFGPDTRFRIAALFADQDDARRVLLVLERGSLRVSRGHQSDAILRVDTPSGSATLGNRGTGMTRPDATFTLTPEGSKGSRLVFLVHGGQATISKGTLRTQVFAGQRLTVYGPEDGLDRISDFNTFALDEFDTWAGPLMEARVSESASRVPQEIRYFAGDLDENGKWVFMDDEDSWVWSPASVSEDWEPYSDGYWGAYGGGMTWVGSEPWSYVTCHHGRWGWRAGIGWYWIPGVYYSPAWVAWNCHGDRFGWSPLGRHNRPCHWRGGVSWNIVGIHDLHRRDLRNWYERNPGVHRAFEGAEGDRRPWFHGRLVVRGDELRDPLRFRAVIDHREILRERVQVYTRTAETSTGRTILRPGTRDDGSRREGFSHWEHAGTPAVRTNPIFRNPEVQPPRRDPEAERRGNGGAVGFPPRNEPIAQPTPARPVIRAPREEPQPLSVRPFPTEGRLERHDPAPSPSFRPDPIRQEPVRQEPARRETPRQEAPRQEPARHETPRQEAPRQEPARHEAPRQEAPRQEHHESPRAEPTKSESKGVERK